MPMKKALTCVQWAIWTSVLVVNCSFANTVVESTPNNNLFLWIIGGLCTALFTVACVLFSWSTARLSHLETIGHEHGERLASLETGFERCHNCNSEPMHPHPVRRKGDHK